MGSCRDCHVKIDKWGQYCNYHKDRRRRKTNTKSRNRVVARDGVDEYVDRVYSMIKFGEAYNDKVHDDEVLYEFNDEFDENNTEVV